MSIILRLALPLLAALALAGSALADDDAPLQLGSEHLGMTSEGIAEAEREAETERIVEEAIEKSEWTDEDLAEEGFIAEEHECECPVEAAPVPAPVVTRAEGVSDYDSCVEVAIRSGNGFRASSAVCQALFPEMPEATDAPDAAAVVTPDLSAAVTTY